MFDICGTSSDLEGSKFRVVQTAESFSKGCRWLIRVIGNQGQVHVEVTDRRRQFGRGGVAPFHSFQERIFLVVLVLERNEQAVWTILGRLIEHPRYRFPYQLAVFFASFQLDR